MLVKQYVPEIMKAVVALPEQQVCGAVGLCSSSSMTGAAPACSLPNTTKDDVSHKRM